MRSRSASVTLLRVSSRTSLSTGPEERNSRGSSVGAAVGAGVGAEVGTASTAGVSSFPQPASRSSSPSSSIWKMIRFLFISIPSCVQKSTNISIADPSSLRR